jgi:signal transduction histidine kinase
MLRHLPVAVSQFDIDGRLMDQNPEALDLFGGLRVDPRGCLNRRYHGDPSVQTAAKAVAPVSSTEQDVTDPTLSRKSDNRSPADQQQQQQHEECLCFSCRFVDRELGHHILQQVQSTGQDYSTEAQQHTTRGVCWSALKVRRSQDPVTQTPVILYSARDITEVVQAKNEADAANMEKSEMLAVLAHEIRTPLVRGRLIVSSLCRSVTASE